ncbi:hypothetical protein P22_3445 [Propionispora sp. 2/2-37]|uniref:YjbQ family protein n=1 Tax=Propionispora sp. 2/2-37 TaxID=1677858 RepID=UPI0006BB6A9C|nr:YjbQ family protein [Propionispora sp. 2/2-37]CUH97318.1 hypothetical protein P22_3445 [Propionispora sp. 2/2-37]
MIVYGDSLVVTSNGNRPSYHEITSEVRRVIAESKVQDGIVVVATPHTTCSIFFEEYMHDKNYNGDEVIQVDLNNVMDKIIPRCVTEGQYRSPGPEHTKFAMGLNDPNYPPDPGTLLNTDAHLRASLIGSSATFVIREGKLMTGTVGYIYFVDWDQNRVRNRNIYIQVLGK